MIHYEFFFFVKQKTAYEMRISDWSSDVCSSDLEGEAVHGISREELAAGISPLEALTKANELIGGHTAYCEGGEHDLRWLLHLAQAANIPASFRLGNWKTLSAVLTASQQAQMFRWLDAPPVVHREGADAERLIKPWAV